MMTISIFQFISLLLALFATLVTSQRRPVSQECRDASNALEANERCLNSYLAVVDSFSDRTDRNILQDLNTFCSLDCRGLNSRVITECSDTDNPLTEVDVEEIICAYNGEESCYSFGINPPPEYLAAAAAVNSSRMCSRLEDDAQTCSPDCIMALQNLVNIGGCCVVELFSSQRFAEAVMAADREIASICVRQSNLTEILDTPCQILGSGVNGLTAHGNIIYLLLLAGIVNIMAFSS